MEHEPDRAARLVVEVGAVFVRCLAVFNRLFKIGVNHCAVGGVRGRHRFGRGGVGFLQPHSVHAVDVGHSFAALGRLRELSAVPDKGASAIGQRVADLIVGDRRAVVGREQIVPFGVVAVGHRGERIVRRAVRLRVRIGRFGQQIAAEIVGIDIRFPRERIVLPDQLIHAVVGVGCRLGDPVNTCDYACL